MFECDWLKTNTKDCIHKALASLQSGYQDMLQQTIVKGQQFI